MLNTIFYIVLVAIALPSVIILITFKSLNKIILFITLIVNIMSLLLMVFYIQSIGWNIYIFSLIFIFINNILLASFRFIGSLSFNSLIKEKLINIYFFYTKTFITYPIYILRNFISIVGKMLDFFNNRINTIMYTSMAVNPLKLINKEYDVKSKCTIFTFANNYLLDHKNLFAALFAALIIQSEVKKIGKKIMIVSIFNNDKSFYIHKNIIIDENTTIFSYLEKIKHSIQTFYDSGYPLSAFPLLQVKLWAYESRIGGKKVSQTNSIHQFRRTLHTNNLKNINLIKPLKTPKNINKISIATIDLETIQLNNIQIPISISFSIIINNEIVTIFELIDYNLLLKNPNRAIKSLWLKFMTKLSNLNLHKCIIYSHNLGSFDGYFIFKGLLELPDVNINKVNSIIDELHRFISIDVTWKENKYIFKDSLRLFPVSLQELCSLFEVEGKLQSYNPLFNKISLFENQDLLNSFIEYAKRDSISLLRALIKAQNIFINKHKVDIGSIWSTSTLSFKIFRQNFLELNIPILTDKLDKLIRLAYFGGSTDYYYQYGENLKHYDVNSLYPKAMCNPMPIEFLGEMEGINVNLNDVFGFAEARITTPTNIEIPLLQFKQDNETIHPIGSWIGLYFTEELKFVEKQGYKVELIKVYNFSKGDIFTKYIDFFYSIKKFAVGPLRFIAKMLLNTLYGYFGRRKTLIETKNVLKKDLSYYYGHYTIFSEININENMSTILMSSNLDYDLINEIKEDTGLDLVSNFRRVKTHVGIAAAVTSYARIEMMKLKILLTSLGIKIYYSDTDSLFTDHPLPDYLIGSDLGQLKDELNGGFIKKAYFLGIKKYGYIDDKDVTHSVFSGVERNSLTWNEIEQISKGFTIIKETSIKFFKNFNNLNINIKEGLKTSIIFNPRKKLFNNQYIPVKISIKFLSIYNYYLKIIKNRIISLINKYNLNKFI